MFQRVCRILRETTQKLCPKGSILSPSITKRTIYERSIEEYPYELIKVQLHIPSAPHDNATRNHAHSIKATKQTRVLLIPLLGRVMLAIKVLMNLHYSTYILICRMASDDIILINFSKT